MLVVKYTDNFLLNKISDFVNTGNIELKLF